MEGKEFDRGSWHKTIKIWDLSRFAN